MEFLPLKSKQRSADSPSRFTSFSRDTSGMARLLTLCLCAMITLASTPVEAQNKKGAKRRPVAKKKTDAKTPKLPPLKTPADKQKFLAAIRDSMPVRRAGSNLRYTSSDLDRSLEYRVGRDRSFARLIDDERFVRRVHFDLVGRPPLAKEVRDFVADDTSSKRPRLIDRLLTTDAYARKWARYWKNVIFFEATANRNRTNPKALEDWLAAEFKKGTSWDEIVAELVSAMPIALAYMMGLAFVRRRSMAMILP